MIREKIKKVEVKMKVLSGIHSLIINPTKSYQDTGDEDSKRREDVRENGVLRHDFRFS